MSKWIKKGDNVIVIAGNAKGKTGEVLARIEEKVLVKGVNLCTKYQKKTKEAPGKMYTTECPIHISNVNLCGVAGKPVRLKARIVEDKKELYYKDGQNEIVHRTI